MTDKPPTPPAAPRASNRRPITEIEAWYLECLRLLTAYLKRPPTVTELARYCKRTETPVHRGLQRLADKQRVKNVEGKYIIPVEGGQ